VDNRLTLDAMPTVSVIVPARNEQSCLGRCLESLVSQAGIAFEIIVVDDDSSDRTGEIARSFSVNHVGAALQARPAVAVISAPPLPESWTGKNNAMSAGAKIARGHWLLFTDADTVHKPGSLARAVAEAEQHGAALLSYSPEQEVRTFWEKAVMPVIFAELAAMYPPSKVSDPASPVAAANGQYLLISRETYEAVGGHTKIGNDLLEDVAMARLVKSSSRKVFFRYGGDAVSTRMYRNWSQMKEGWTKNLALLFTKPSQLALHKIGEFILPLFGLYVLLTGLVGFRGSHLLIPGIPERWFRLYFFVGGTCLLLLTLVGLIRRVRVAHFPWSNLARAYLGLPIFAYFLLRSERAYKKAHFDWKGRSYVYSAEEVEGLTSARVVR
jgi:glycosyltransferase involved in cell wall biosynthesis